MQWARGAQNRTLATALSLTIGALAGGAVADLTYGESNYRLAEGLLWGAISSAVVFGGMMVQDARLRGDLIRQGQHRIDELQHQVQTLKATCETLRNAAERWQQASQGHEFTLKGLQVENTQLSSRLSAKTQEITQHQGAIAQLEAEISEWETDFEQLEQAAQAQATEAAQAEYQAKFEAARREHGARVKNAMPTAVANRAEKLAAQQIDDALAAATADLHTRINALETELAQAKAALARNEVEMLALAEEDTDELFDDLDARKVELYDQLTFENSELKLELARLQTRLEAYEQPQYFPDSPQFASANLIISTALKAGILIDKGFRAVNESNGRETYYFDWRGSANPADVVQSLNFSHDAIRRELIGIKDLSRFEFDSAKCLIKVTLATHKRLLDEHSIERLWMSRTRFKEIACKDSVFRLLGGKGFSKSPLARNILGCKLLAGERFELRRYDPTSGSGKDFWRVAPTWDEYSDALLMAAEIFTELEQRKHLIKRINRKELNRPMPPTLYYFVDEVENTVSYLKGLNPDEVAMPEGMGDRKPEKYFTDALLSLARECEHARMGLIFCTQDPQVSAVPGFSRSNIQNFTNIAIGKASASALTSSHNSSKLATLLSDLEPISEYCDRMNAKIDDPKLQVRFALIDRASANRFYAELPLLGQYGFDKLEPSEPYDFQQFSSKDYPESCRSLDDCLLSKANQQKRANLPDSLSTKAEMIRKCPNCGSTRLEPAGKDKRSKKPRFRCLDAPKGDRRHPQTFVDPLLKV
ncbi:MAG: hypothetical protein AAGF01_01660 [Cyanobacteria bacterium P01_G01_bin.38]